MSNTQQNAGNTNSFDFSKAEETVKNIIIPNSQFGAKWIKGEGYAIGIENIKVTKNYETLEEALNQIGYGVDIDEDKEEILIKLEGIDWELIVRIMKALLIIQEQNAIENIKEGIKLGMKHPEQY